MARRRVEAGGPKLLDSVRDAIRVRHYSRRTEVAYVTWIQALAAVLFLYEHVLHIQIGEIEQVVRAKQPIRLPVVLGREEVGALLSNLDGTMWIIGMLSYGAGLRLEECLALRVKDVDFDRRQLTVRRGKGQKDRVRMLPGVLVDPLRQHLAAVRRVHEADVKEGLGRVTLPEALGRKYPNAATEWGSQFLLPAARICRDPRWGPPSGFTWADRTTEEQIGNDKIPAWR